MGQGADLLVNAALEEEKGKQACAEALAKLLDHYNCELDPKVIISLRGTRIRVDLIAKTPVAAPPKG